MNTKESKQQTANTILQYFTDRALSSSSNQCVPKKAKMGKMTLLPYSSSASLPVSHGEVVDLESAASVGAPAMTGRREVTLSVQHMSNSLSPSGTVVSNAILSSKARDSSLKQLYKDKMILRELKLLCWDSGRKVTSSRKQRAQQNVEDVLVGILRACVSFGLSALMAQSEFYNFCL
ncbi:hypothetical protein BC830DRAFT_1076454 [Chytriomyces sp. MP71]|nr:hypothetical protein BC830DRAFT_1076454 [Chytriomyces sp. MP71]